MNIWCNYWWATKRKWQQCSQLGTHDLIVESKNVNHNTLFNLHKYINHIEILNQNNFNFWHLLQHRTPEGILKLASHGNKCDGRRSLLLWQLWRWWWWRRWTNKNLWKNIETQVIIIGNFYSLGSSSGTSFSLVRHEHCTLKPNNGFRSVNCVLQSKSKKLV